MKKIYWKALFPAFVFLLMQVVFSFLVPLVMLVCHPSAMKDIVAKGPASIDHSAFVSPASMAIAIMLAGLSTCYILWRKGMVRLPEAFDGRSIRWPLTFLGILGVILGVIATDLLSEQLNLPNIIEAEMTEIVGTFWGVLAVAVIGPIVEEVVFREGIQGCLLRGGRSQCTLLRHHPSNPGAGAVCLRRRPHAGRNLSEDGQCGDHFTAAHTQQQRQRGLDARSWGWGRGVHPHRVVRPHSSYRVVSYCDTGLLECVESLSVLQEIPVSHAS